MNYLRNFFVIGACIFFMIGFVSAKADSTMVTPPQSGITPALPSGLSVLAVGGTPVMKAGVPNYGDNVFIATVNKKCPSGTTPTIQLFVVPNNDGPSSGSIVNYGVALKRLELNSSGGYTVWLSQLWVLRSNGQYYGAMAGWTLYCL